jgi:hypothetical protein
VFAASPLDFTPPVAVCKQHVPQTTNTAEDDEQCGHVKVVDMDGDAKPDLLEYRTCNDPGVGATKWLFYPNTGAGWATTPVTLALPAGYSAFPEPQSDLTCKTPDGAPVNIPAYDLWDANGDHLPDIVLSASCTDVAVGKDHLLFYPGTGTGFGSPGTFTLIKSFPAGVSPSSSMTDFDGDGIVDVVYQSSADDPTRSVYRGSCAP